MTGNNPEDRKHKLIDAIDKVSQVAKQVTKQGQNIVEDANLQCHIAQSAKRIFSLIPDDSYLTQEEWDQRTDQWTNTAKGLEDFSQSINIYPVAFNTASTATGTSGYAFKNFFTRNLSINIQNEIDNEILKFTDLIESSSWDKKIEEDYRRLGIEKDRNDCKSGLSLLQSAHCALLRPSNEAVDASAVLIPARESIHRTLADLLSKRRTQEPAKKTKDKIVSVCKQLAFKHVADQDINQLAYDAEQLIDQLSEAKQHSFSSHQISVLFNRTRSFLKALLSIIDDKKR